MASSVQSDTISVNNSLHHLASIAMTIIIIIIIVTSYASANDDRLRMVSKCKGLLGVITEAGDHTMTRHLKV